MTTVTTDKIPMSLFDVLLWIFTLTLILIIIVGLLRKWGIFKDKNTSSNAILTEKHFRQLNQRLDTLEANVTDIKTVMADISESNRRTGNDIRKMRLTLTVLGSHNHGSKS